MNEVKFPDPKVQEILNIGKYFIQTYLASRNGLKQLGILRSERSLQGDYAEWFVANLMGLKLEESTVHKGIDAVDNEGKTYQIKSRIVKTLSQNTSFDIQNIDFKFDYLIPVFFNKSFEILAILKIPYDVVKELGTQTQSSFRFRWNKKVAEDKRIIKIIWPDDEPLK